MRLLNVHGAKIPERVLIPATDASVPFPWRWRAETPAVRHRVARAALVRAACCELSRHCCRAAIAASGAGSSPRPTISSRINEGMRQKGAVGVTLWSKVAELGRIKEFFGG